MDEILNTIIGNSPVIAVLIYFIFSLNKDKKTNKDERDIKDKQLDVEKTAFREYLIRTNSEHHEIIKRNTDAFERLIDVIEKINIKPN